MNCQDFRATFAPATEDAALLGHLRSCDACLDHALAVDPDVFFRAVGGEEIVPPGGIDAFVGDVMREVRVRSAETVVSRPNVPMWRRYAVAAALAVTVGGSWLITREQFSPAPVPVQQAKLSQPAARVATVATVAATVPAVSRPVIESYESTNATIVEVPTEGAGDVKLVMIFDENLPKNL